MPPEIYQFQLILRGNLPGSPEPATLCESSRKSVVDFPKWFGISRD